MYGAQVFPRTSIVLQRMSSMSQEHISQVLKNIIRFILDPTVEVVPTKIKENCEEVSSEIEAEDELETSLF